MQYTHPPIQVILLQPLGRLATSEAMKQEGYLDPLEQTGHNGIKCKIKILNKQHFHLLPRPSEHFEATIIS